MKATADASLKILREYGVRPALNREGVVILAAHDARSGFTPPQGQPTDGLTRIEDQGQEMAAQLNHDLQIGLSVLEEELKHIEQDVEAQRRVVRVRQDSTVEKAEHRRRTKAEVDSIAAAKGRFSLPQRKLSKPWYAALLVVFGLADTILNATALLVIGEGNVVVWGLAFALVAALLWMSHVAGTEMREAADHPNDPAEQRQRLWAVGVVAVIVLFLFTIGYIRARFLEAQGVGGELLAVYGLQLIVAAAAIAAAYYYANEYADALEQAGADEERAREEQLEQEELLGQLEADRQGLLIQKISHVTRYLLAAEAGFVHTNELKDVYAMTYRTIRLDAGLPAELSTLPTRVPGWIPEWVGWLNEQTGFDRPKIGTAWQRELPSPN